MADETIYLSLEEVRQHYTPVEHLLNIREAIIELLFTIDGDLFSPRPILINAKRPDSFMTYPYKEHKTTRTNRNDRVFPLDTVAIKQFNTKHDSDIEKATIHVGPYANELTRSFNVVALTIACDIFFRNNAYNPDSEEGRKTIAHELTHVGQYQKGDIQNRTLESLEKEAEIREQQEVYDDNDLVTVTLRGRSYVLRKSKKKYYAQWLAKNMSEYMAEQKVILDKKDYLSLLRAYEEWRG